MPRSFLVIICAVAAALLTLFVIWYFWGADDGTCAITCLTDEQCGGDVTGEPYCQGADVRTMVQHNTCIDAGTCKARCATTFEEKVILTCERSCANGACA